MILADSNLIIYAASGNYPGLIDWFAENHPAVSAISLIEVLGYHKLRVDEKAVLENLFAELTLLYPSADVFRGAVVLRQQRAISVADALIAATAIQHNLSVATHDTKDFAWIEGLQLLDPMKPNDS